MQPNKTAHRSRQMDKNFPFLEKEEWSPIFKRTFEVTKEPYLQSFQYKILTGY